ncbi:MAG: DUF2520 domain-containing protein [Ignavibacteria bacterium]|nr:DUF2520 domain-containing protein [Ignavibacteria bacterium]
MKKHPNKITIIGAGQVGSTLALLFKENGFEIVSVISRTKESAKKLGKLVQCKNVSTSIKDISIQTEFLLLAVPDNLLKNIADEIASVSHLNFKKIVVAHTSGVHSVDVLSSLKTKGANVAGFHPIQSFPKHFSVQQLKKNITNNICFGIECEKKLQPKLSSLAKKLGGKFVFVPSELKPLYHLVCVVSSSFSVTLLKVIEEISSHFPFAKNWKDAFSPILLSSISNALATSPTKALTGPIPRGDLHTIELHLNALVQFSPELISFYKELSTKAVSIAIERGSISNEQEKRLLQVLKKK